MLILGIESSCDETGVALYDPEKGLLADALHTQIEMHRLYGGVVPELASRDHIRRVIPLINAVMDKAGKKPSDLSAVAVTEGPGLAGALLVGNSVAHGIGFALGVPVIGIHHLEGHLLSPLLSDNPPKFPFIALLVSGGHTQLMEVKGLGEYSVIGETLDDAVGEAFDQDPLRRLARLIRAVLQSRQWRIWGSPASSTCRALCFIRPTAISASPVLKPRS